MFSQLPTFFDHSRHTLHVHGVNTTLDVLAFEGEEKLSQPFRYRVEFTCVDQDIAADRILGQPADFALNTAPHLLPKAIPGLPAPEVNPLRTLHGVITAFKRLSGSRDEARYEITLEPRLALLSRGRQFLIYQQQSVPQIVDSILRNRHGFEGQDVVFTLAREYPKREQVMQYGESDLAFIDRLLAEVGIWYRFSHDERLRIDVVSFHDDQRHYLNPGLVLPYRTQSGLGNSGEDSVWNAQVSHEVVENHLTFRAYHYRDAGAWLDGDVDQTRGATTTYGEAYHYAEPYTALGDALDQAEDLQSESGFFYARLRHERYLNRQTRLSGVTGSASLVPGRILDVTGGAPRAFEPGVVITSLMTRAARDRSFEATFEAIPHSYDVCYRPPLRDKPQIAGTIPARVSSTQPHDTYSHIDSEGRYKVHFLFDRDTWKQGEESLWLRLARPYAGDTHGLHLPLICGTEVGIAFENGDPDRPYIAHAVHDSHHPDHVTLTRRDYTRNVLRTPANNKLRLEDERNQEHIKLSTDYAGKSQLNLGHLVNSEKKKRGDGFELRTDGWGAIRAGSGVFISADAQPCAQGGQLDMQAAVEQLQRAGDQLQQLSEDAEVSHADPADVQAQLKLLKDDLNQLKSAVLLLSAPKGIALTSGGHLQLAAHDHLMLGAGADASVSVAKRLFMGIGQGVSLFVRKLGLKLIANEGPVTLQAQNDRLELLARQRLNITSSEDEIHITAKKRIVLNAGGSYLSLGPDSIESGTQDYRIKAADFSYIPQASQNGPNVPTLPPVLDVAPEVHATWPSLSDGGVHDYVPPPEKPIPVKAPEELEEEEEEEELSEGITLRLGLFFDGTGNNQSNAAATEQCRLEDLSRYSVPELNEIDALCKRYGYGEFDGTMYNSAPDNSYGNAPSNVVHLHELYPDNVTDVLSENIEMGYVKVYVEGIGTRSGGKDATLYGQGLGQGETGVIARVMQVPKLLEQRLRMLSEINPGLVVEQVEFDIFGFSRGAAAARHCANELLKPGRGVFGPLLKAGHSGLSKHFDSVRGVCINLIGLFDTVTAISSPLRGDFSPADDNNHGVNLYLPPDCARKVIQLHARDEYRLNFSLNSLVSSHLQIELPGAHSDVGGGYRPLAKENVWLTHALRVAVPDGQNVQSQRDWALIEREAQSFRDLDIAREGHIELKAWLAATPPQGKRETNESHYWVAAVLNRPVRGELSLIALRVMRELAVRHGVPFESISDADQRVRLPDELKPIAETVLQQVMAGKAVSLEPDQEKLLRTRYIHQSAHCTPDGPFLLSKPAPMKRRFVHLDFPQKGYPQ